MKIDASEGKLDKNDHICQCTCIAAILFSFQIRFYVENILLLSSSP